MLDSTIVRAAAAALALCGATAVHAKAVVDAASVQKATAELTVVEAAARLKTLGESGAVDELSAAIAQLANIAPTDSIAYEWLLDRGLHELGRLKPTSAARALALKTAQLEPQIFVRADPDHGPRIAPLYDPGATARFVLRMWDRNEARDEALTALASGGRSLLTMFAERQAPAQSDPLQAGVVDAFQRTPLHRLLSLRDALATSLLRDERVDELAAVAAERLHDVELFTLVLAHADAAVALQAMQAAAQTLDPAARLEVLQAGAQRADIASASMLQLGRLAAHDSRARSLLFDALDDSTVGASAAAALASQHDSAIAAELGRRLQQESREKVRRTLVLALQLDGSSAARAQLAQFVDARAGSASLRKEVSGWLAQ